jgi:hypothetical protein
MSVAFRARLLAELCVQVVVREGDHPAVGVGDHRDLLGAQEPVGDDQRADRVLGDEPARVADHVRVTLLEAEELGGVEACVHARHDREPSPGRHGQIALPEPVRIDLVRSLQDVALRHGSPLALLQLLKERKLYKLKRPASSG